VNVLNIESEARVRIESFFHTFKRSLKPLLLLDYDGTLADFRIDRFKARPWSGVTELLSRIQRQGRTEMRVITGRPPEEVPPLLGLNPTLEVWGLHGAKRLYPDGRSDQEETPPETREKLDEVRTRLRIHAFGGLYEDKPNAAVVHWRGIAHDRAKRIEQKTRALFEPLASNDGLSLLVFESGLELRTGRDKGGAVREIVREADGCTPVVYLGDDFTDESAFAAVNELEGPHLSVLVRRAWRETAAEVWLKPPEELKWFLERWMEAVA